MSSLRLSGKGDNMRIGKSGADRREHRRHDLETQGITVDRVDAARRVREKLGQLVDISAGGVRIRTSDEKFQTDNQVRVRLELPVYAGISPFVDTDAGQPQPKREWTGWMTVRRVHSVGENRYEVAGQLVDMEEMDRGMLSLYLSTQPLAA
ncbi:MAG TPA: PilZ domain-containing protein [Tepidisphaeraceae bacterium]|jgi:hypothetical protein|nr:PilZ domain-containing protein [Tepidisphaeraceae bacterium]